MSQNSKWAAWQQLIDQNLLKSESNLEPVFDEKSKNRIKELAGIESTSEDIDLEPITEEETGLEFNETPYVDTVEDCQIPDISVLASKPKKGNKA